MREKANRLGCCEAEIDLTRVWRSGKMRDDVQIAGRSVR